jgi:hypothetical protein
VLSRRGRLDEADNNTGLGLSIARELVEATRGRITLGAAMLGGLRVQLDWLGNQSLPGCAEDSRAETTPLMSPIATSSASTSRRPRNRR